MKVSEQLNAIISKLDEAAGRLKIASITDTNVKRSMETITSVSNKLGELTEQIGLSE